jgi:hypothetical protein
MTSAHSWRATYPTRRSRDAKAGHHKVSFDSIKLAVSAGADQYDDYFETGRRKRNVIDYTRAQVATDTETEEIVEKAREFYEFVEGWISSKFPNLHRQQGRSAQ